MPSSCRGCHRDASLVQLPFNMQQVSRCDRLCHFSAGGSENDGTADLRISRQRESRPCRVSAPDDATTEEWRRGGANACTQDHPIDLNLEPWLKFGPSGSRCNGLLVLIEALMIAPPQTKSQRCRLLIAVMDRACRLSGLSRRQLAWQLGVSVGTVNAYYIGRVDPLRSRAVIQQRLARLNGVGLDALLEFYASGVWMGPAGRLPELNRDPMPCLRKGTRAADARAGCWPEEEGLQSPMLEIGLQMLRRRLRCSGRAQEQAPLAAAR